MEDQKIAPAKITKPIQLLAAWLVGLVAVNGTLLGTAVSIAGPDWLIATLVIAGIFNVPLFLVCLFLLQTKFRPEMQEDSYYARYLESNTGKLITTSATDVSVHQLRTELHEFNQRSLTVFSSVEATVRNLANQVGILVDSSKVEDDSKTQIRQLVESVDRSTRAIEVVKQQVTATPFRVEINDLLPHYEQIRKELRQKGISIGRTFGSTSQTPEVPKQRIVGFGPNVPIDKLRVIVDVVQSYGFDRIHFTDQAYNEGRVYLGSYVYRASELPQAVPIDGAIMRALHTAEGTLDELVAEIESART